ncbi:phage portal protein [Methylobacterium sp. NMS14P]|uniref:phage portal protein n=1 Tax=Methylobacterium sp. NMS14P TaxID=2894310 RepID=UPI002358142F|nr:phage portal protein [Methylobacterium sp. NMS14P]WCS27798.1 phage portal protein [Methylobacterium sp. NMS14P]
MSETESEMWQRSGLTAQDLATVPGPLRTDSAEGWDDIGWHDVGDLLGMGGRGGRSFYGQHAVGVALAIMCADVKARDLSKAEMLLWRRRGRGWTMVEADQHPIAELLMTRPNPWHTWPELWRMVGLHIELAQNAYLYKDITVDGTVEALIPIQPARCRARVSTSGKLFYEIYAGNLFEEAQLGDSYMVVPADRIIHLRGRLWDGLYGLSNFALGGPIFDLVSAIAEFQRNIFGNDGKQPIVYQTSQIFGNKDESDAAFRRLKQQLTERTRRAVANGDPILLEAGLEAKSIAINAVQAESKDSFNQQIMRVCGLMNCPPHKIFALEAVAYNNMSAMNRQYYSDCLHPLAHGIQENFRLSLFTRKEWPIFGPQFDQVALMATDLEALSKLVDMGMKDGLMTFDEGREVLPFRLNPLPAGGDQRMVPVNMSLIGPDGQVIHAGTGQKPTNPGAGEGESPDNNAGKAGPRLVHSAGAA